MHDLFSACAEITTYQVLICSEPLPSDCFFLLCTSRAGYNLTMFLTPKKKKHTLIID